MAKVKVYKVKVYDMQNDLQAVSRRMATREGVRKMNGTIIEGTEVEIDESQLEPGEQWTRVDFEPR